MMRTTANDEAAGGLAELSADAWSTLDALARALSVQEARLQPTLDAIVAAAAGAIPGHGHAGLILMVDGRLVPQATHGRPPEELDIWQQEHGRGPCIEAAQSQSPVVSDNTASDDRWAGFGSYAASLGVWSMLCVPLSGPNQLLGTLSLYSPTIEGFADFHRPLAQLCATHAALALSDAHRTEQLHLAMMNRDVIGQAKGILMERHKLTAQMAFAMLSQASQLTNQRLPVVAAHLVETGALPGATTTTLHPLFP
jgi:GAF domain-containing protein